MNRDTFHRYLSDFNHKFSTLALQYDGTIEHSTELESAIGEYSAFITNGSVQDTWTRLERQLSEELIQLVEDTRSSSARCVALMEKYRALKLLGGLADDNIYFHNIEACIEQEFGSFQVSAESRVVLIGSGSFPMTPLLIARRTGASVVGIDIDEEAVGLGRQVVARLGTALNIRLEHTSAEQLEAIRVATHIIFSSTVPEKYDLLDRLHALTSTQVVMVMRYGDRLKSLFNYPMQEVDERKWRLAENITRPGHIFDIALYQKA